MKRFYREAAVVAADGGHGIALDGRPVRTPARNPLVLPSPALAEAISREWSAQGERIDPRSMPMTGLANAAIDRVVTDPAAFAAPLARYAVSDLLCYRALAPADLVSRQASAWDPLLAWARRRYDIDFALACGVVPVAQPDSTITRLAAALGALDPFRLAGLAPIVTIGGSLVAALALQEGEIAPEAAFDATHVDELWQAEKWGDDADAANARANRRADFLAAAGFLELL